LKYIVYNTSHSPQVRAQAALDLTRMNGDTRFMRVKNRCAVSGRGRAIIRQFKYVSPSKKANGRMNRMQFRDFALAGELPGVIKASW
jgi:small subunit ribosomal protein S14